MVKPKTQQPTFWQKNSYKIIGYGVIAMGILSCILMVNTVQGSSRKQNVVDAPTEEIAETVPELYLSLKDTNLAIVNAGAKDIKYKGNSLSIKDNGEVVYNFEGEVELKGRGNSTWAQIKKPYQIKFDNKTDLFGMGASKKWVLLADYLDPTHLRNDISNYLSKMLDMDFTRDGKFVNLYVDDEYIGFYYLTHKVEIGSATVALEDNLGILLEMENLHGDPTDEVAFVSKGNRNTFVLSETVSEDEILIRAATELFERDYNLLEKAVKDQDYEAISKLIDVESFAKYFIISEFSVNPDAYSSSFYFYKDGPDDKIHAGPIWDFDYAFSNQAWCWGKGTDTISATANLSDYESTLSDGMGSPIMYDLYEIPEFANLVKDIYSTLISDKSSELLAYFDERAELIQNHVARDSEKWGTGSFNDSAAYLREWLLDRFVYFENLYSNNQTN